MSAKDRREILNIVDQDGVPLLTTVAQLKKFRTRPSMTDEDLLELNFVIGDLEGQALPVSMIDTEEQEIR